MEYYQKTTRQNEITSLSQESNIDWSRVGSNETNTVRIRVVSKSETKCYIQRNRGHFSKRFRKVQMRHGLSTHTSFFSIAHSFFSATAGIQPEDWLKGLNAWLLQGSLIVLVHLNSILGMLCQHAQWSFISTMFFSVIVRITLTIL